MNKYGICMCIHIIMEYICACLLRILSLTLKTLSTKYLHVSTEENSTIIAFMLWRSILNFKQELKSMHIHLQESYAQVNISVLDLAGICVAFRLSFCHMNDK